MNIKKSQNTLLTNKNFKCNLIFLLFFLISTLSLHFRSYNKLPVGLHAWQQADHYAISLSFLDNGFDFFHPIFCA